MGAFHAIGTLFTATNQFFFMGLFFFLSGYFVPGAVARKGRARFIRDRAMRLGVPLVVFSLVAAPYVEHVASLRGDAPSTTVWDELAGFVHRRDFPPGPLWFVETLLVFSTLYALVAPRSPSAAAPRVEVLPQRYLFGLAGFLAVATFLVRLFWHAGQEWHHLQLAFFPQYVVLFVLGTLAERRGWLGALAPAMLKIWVPVLAAVLVALVGLMSVYLPRGPAGLEPFVGGAHPEALALAVLENLYCVGASVTALVVFRELFDGRSRWARALAGDAYAVYVLHAPVIVFLAFSLRDVALGPWVKFVFLTVVGATTCFAASHFVLRRSEVVRRVL